MKEKIISSALRRIEQVGFRKFTIDDIVNDLQISKKTVYKFFANKDEIVEAAAEALHNQEMLRVEDILDSSLPWEEKIQKIMSLYKEKQSPWIYAELERFYPQVWAKCQKVDAVVQIRIKKLLQEGVQAGVIRADVSLDLVIIMYKSIMLHLVYKEDVLPGLNMTLHQAIQMIQEILSCGIVRRTNDEERGVVEQ